MSSAENSAKLRIVRDKDFAKRLDQAVSGHPHAPDGHGRQKWLRERIESRFSIKVSPEAVRKWFAAESRPRPTLMRHLAHALEVDEAWLSLGLTPTVTPDQRRKGKMLAAGSVNLIAGMIEMSGGHVAFPTATTDAPDLYAIIDAQQHSLVIRSGKNPEEVVRITVPPDHEKSVVLFVNQISPVNYGVLRVPSELIEKHGKRQGGYMELDIRHNGQFFSIGDDALPIIQSFNHLDGEIPRRR